MKFQKGISLLLALVLILGVLPLQGFAAEQDVQVLGRVTSEEEADAQSLFSVYFDRLVRGEADPYAGAGTRLNGQEKVLYDALATVIPEIAGGLRSSAVITVGQTYTGILDVVHTPDVQAAIPAVFTQDMLDRVIRALLTDMPYDLYWYDKMSGCLVEGISHGGELKQLRFSFTVSVNFRGSGETQVDIARALSAAAAADKVKALVAKYETEGDFAKLLGYRDEICALTSYDHSAAAGGYFSQNSGPWQLIWVFDGREDTKVVCEGYAKAFAYLCDLTNFAADISCNTVTGTMEGIAHMWNIVSVDGVNYLADITNSDEDTVGSDGSLFLAGGIGSIPEGYEVNGLYYVYDTGTTNLWDMGADSILNLSSQSSDLGGLRIDTVAMYRLYNPYSGEHFYTGSTQERDTLTAAGWNYEGIAWNAPRKSGEPVYRLYNPNSSDHHYTMSAQERDNLVSMGWKYEGVAWNSAGNDQVPQYRLYNPNADCGSHHYTGSKEELENLVRVGWIFEGIGWYGIP